MSIRLEYPGLPVGEGQTGRIGSLEGALCGTFTDGDHDSANEVCAACRGAFHPYNFKTLIILGDPVPWNPHHA